MATTIYLYNLSSILNYPSTNWKELLLEVLAAALLEAMQSI